MNALPLWLAVVLWLFAAEALAQRTGGSFGGSRWGSGAPRVSAPRIRVPLRPAPRVVARPTPVVYRVRPVVWQPVVRRRPVRRLSWPAGQGSGLAPSPAPLPGSPHRGGAPCGAGIGGMLLLGGASTLRRRLRRGA